MCFYSTPVDLLIAPSKRGDISREGGLNSHMSGIDERFKEPTLVLVRFCPHTGCGAKVIMKHLLVFLAHAFELQVLYRHADPTGLFGRSNRVLPVQPLAQGLVLLAVHASC